MIVKSTAVVQCLLAKLQAGVLEDLATAQVNLKAAAADSLVQKRHAVHLDPPGHIEDPCHTGVYQGHEGPCDQCP